MTQTTNIKPSLVVKSNDLIEARYNLSVVEQRIFLFTICQINRDDDDFKVYRIRVADILDVTGSKSKNMYDQLNQASERLMKRHMHIPKNGKGFLKVSFVSSVEYFPGLGIIELSFDPKLKPYLLELKSRFTIYDIRNVLKLESSYSIRLYEFMKQYETIGKRVIPIDELRDVLGLQPGQYRSYTTFKERVIDKPQEELRKYCDLYFTYREIKSGRKVANIEFTIKSQGSKFAAAAKGTNDEEALTNALKDMGLSASQIASILLSVDLDTDRIFALIDYTKKKMAAGEIKKNTGAYLYTLIRDGAQVISPHEREQKHVAEKRKARLEEEKQTKLQLEQLENQFKKLRMSKVDQIIEQFKDWEGFEEYARTLPPFFSKNVIQNGRLNYQPGEHRHFLSMYISSKVLPDHDNDFKDWVFRNHGLKIEKSKSGSGYHVIGQQTILFE